MATIDGIHDRLVEWVRDRTGQTATSSSTFPELGLDSFDIIAMVDFLREATGNTELSLLQVIEHPTVGELVDGLAPSAPAVPAWRDHIVAWISERTRRDVDPATPFVELGLDSFDIVALADELRDAIGDETISLLTVIEHSSVSALVAHLGGAAGPSDDGPAVPRLEKSNAVATTPSYWQEVVLAWEAKREPSITWCAGALLDLLGAIEPATLQLAIHDLAARNECLRLTAYRAEKRLGLCAPERIELTPIDLEDADERTVARIQRELLSVPFALNGEPMFRPFLIRRGEQHHTLCLMWHQLVHDATGARPIVQELLELYEGRRTGRTVPMPDRLRFADFAAWRRAYFESEPGKERVRIEQERMAGALPLPVPVRPPGLPHTTQALGAKRMLAPDEARRVLDVCRDIGVTHFVATAAAVAIVMGHEHSADEVTLVAPVSTRTRSELQPIIGRMGAWCPIRVHLAGRTVGDVIEQIQGQLIYLNDPVPAQFLFDTDDIFEHPLARVVVNAPSLRSLEASYEGVVEGLKVVPVNPAKPTVCPPPAAVLVARLGEKLAMMALGQAALHEQEWLEKRLERSCVVMTQLDPHVSVAELQRQLP